VVPSVITEDEIWTSDKVYRVNAPLEVREATVTILPGTLVVVDGVSIRLTGVNPGFRVLGNPRSPVVFIPKFKKWDGFVMNTNFSEFRMEHVLLFNGMEEKAEGEGIGRREEVEGGGRERGRGRRR
jgi:hypothetical protein